MILLTLTIATALDAYQTERRTVVIAARRLDRACDRLCQRIGGVNAEDRKAVSAAVAIYTLARRTEDGMQNGTIARELVVLRAALMAAWKQGELNDRPYVALPSPGPPRQRWLTPAEAQSLLRAADSGIHLFLYLALATGARHSAILELTWDRVNFDLGIIDFRAPHEKIARRKRRAIVPIIVPLRRHLLAARNAGDEKRIVPLDASTIRRRLKKAASDAGMEGVTPHVLRHTAATWLLAHKVPLVDTSRMLGHASTLITEQVYAHLMAEALRPAAEVLGSLITWNC